MPYHCGIFQKNLWSRFKEKGGCGFATQYGGKKSTFGSIVSSRYLLLPILFTYRAKKETKKSFLKMFTIDTFVYLLYSTITELFKADSIKKADKVLGITGVNCPTLEPKKGFSKCLLL